MMVKFLASAPINLPQDQAEAIAPELQYYWAAIAEGDAKFEFPHFPPRARQYLERLNRSLALDPTKPVQSDNHTTIPLRSSSRRSVLT